MDTVAHMATIPPEQWSILPGYTFSVEEVGAVSGLPESAVEVRAERFRSDTWRKEQDLSCP